MNHETFYPKEAFGPSIEFPNDARVFQLDAFPDLTAFIVLSEEPRVVQANFASTPNASTIASTPNTSTITTRPSRTLSRRALTCVKIVRADLHNNGKPSNLRLHNHTVHVNICSKYNWSTSFRITAAIVARTACVCHKQAAVGQNYYISK